MQRAKGETLLDYLDDIYMRYGYYANLGTSMVMTGAEGTVQIQAIQQGLRQQPPTAVAGWEVTQHVDHWDETGRHGRFLSETDRASRNVLVFRLENGARVLVRPSGTEPKNKVYIEVPAPPVGRQAGREALARAVKRTLTRWRSALPMTLRARCWRSSTSTCRTTRCASRAWYRSISGSIRRALHARLGGACGGAVSRGHLPGGGLGLDRYASGLLWEGCPGLVREAMTTYVCTEREQAERRGGTDAFQRLQYLKALESAFFTPTTA